ncbi:MAG: MmcQ/YjbR family DNA-binding protein [Pseudonocardiaceae bacterium]
MNPSSLDPDRLHRLRTICLAFPEATEKQAWGDPTWRVRNRIFAMQKGNYDGGRPSLWLKAPAGAAEVLIAPDRDRFFIPPYVGQKGWIGVYLDGSDADWDELADLITDSYRLIAPKRLVTELDDR